MASHELGGMHALSQDEEVQMRKSREWQGREVGTRDASGAPEGPGRARFYLADNRRTETLTTRGRRNGDKTVREAGQMTKDSGDAKGESAELKEMEARKASAESHALREEPGEGDAEQALEAEKAQARVEGLIGNPD